MKDMGNIRPQELRDIESLVWSMVLKIARGEAKAPEALEELMRSIPWNIVEAWGPEDPNRIWFRPGNSLFPITRLTRLNCGFNTASMNLAAENPTNGGIREGLLLSATNFNGQEHIPGSESHSSGVDLGIEGSACGKETMGAESVGISSLPAQQVGTSIAETPSHGVVPENEGGSRGDVDMEDGESGHDTRTPVPGPGDKGDSTMRSANAGTTSEPQKGGSDRDVTMDDVESCPEPKTTAPGLEGNDARTAPEPEDVGHPGHGGPKDQGDPGVDVTMANVESSVARTPGVMPTELNRDDSAGNEPRWFEIIPGRPPKAIETRSSHRLREAVTSAPASEPPAAPERELNEDKRKTPARSQKNKKKEPATKQKRAPSTPPGMWEIIDVDALVRWCSTMNLIGPDFSFRKTETLLTSTSRNNHRKSRQTRQSLPMTDRV
jgi:hypothetical protein